jgi:hypothetical protein
MRDLGISELDGFAGCCSRNRRAASVRMMMSRSSRERSESPPDSYYNPERDNSMRNPCMNHTRPDGHRQLETGAIRKGMVCDMFSSRRNPGDGNGRADSAACAEFRISSPRLQEPEDHAEVGDSRLGQRCW